MQRRPVVRPLGGAEVLVVVSGLWGLSIIIYYIFRYHYSLEELGGMGGEGKNPAPNPAPKVAFRKIKL